MIPKIGKPGERPLTMGSPREKVVQKAIQMVLSGLFEPTFLDCSHGFRPKRGCLSALKMVDRDFRGAKWVIEADLTKCFDHIPHEYLLAILGRTIKCEKTMALIKSGLKAGYYHLGNLVTGGLIGTPQGNVLSPLLCNIYLHELDCFVSGIVKEFNKGRCRPKNPVYRKLQYLLEKTKKGGGSTAATLAIRHNMRKVHSKDQMNPNFVRIGYVRYADDFVISVIGPRSLAVSIMARVRAFLRDVLGLELNSKSTLTDFNDGIRFLGAVITNRKVTEKPLVLSGSRKVRVTPRLSFHAPILILLKRLVLRGYFKWQVKPNRIRPTAMRSLMNLDHRRIILLYNSVINEIMNYYKFADNRKSLGLLSHGLKLSCALTLALKYKLRTARKAFKAYGSLLADPASNAKLQVPATHMRLSHFERFDLG